MGFPSEEVPARDSAECSPLPSRLSLNILGGGGRSLLDLVKGTVEIKVWLRVPELWMACRVSEVCGEHNLCSHLTLNPHAERVQAEGHVGVNLACPKVGAPPPKAALRLGRGNAPDNLPGC